MEILATAYALKRSDHELRHRIASAPGQNRTVIGPQD